ncbi:MAG: hypothetical protein ACLPM3_04265 [Terracidiphilus sp.]
MIVNALRGLVKSAGRRLPVSSAEGFQMRVNSSIPPRLAEAPRPLLIQIAALNASIREMDCGIEYLGGHYPEIKFCTPRPASGH